MALATQAQCAEPANVFLKSDHLKKDRRGRGFTFPLKKTTRNGGGNQVHSCFSFVAVYGRKTALVCAHTPLT
jgi:hypothetical protein